MRVRVDLGRQDRAAPAVFEHGLGVPEPGCRVLDGEELDVLAPGQFANEPLENCGVGPRLGKGFHVAQVGRREAASVGELGAQVGGKPVDDFAAPALSGLPLQDVVADPPVETDEFTVDREGGAEPRLANPGFQVGEPGRIIGGNGRGGHGCCPIPRPKRLVLRALGAAGRASPNLPMGRWQIDTCSLGGILGAPGTARSGAAAALDPIVQQALARLADVGDGPRLAISLEPNSMSCTLGYSKLPLRSNKSFIFPDARTAPCPVIYFP
jgi:hypothetical protein